MGRTFSVGAVPRTTAKRLPATQDSPEVRVKVSRRVTMQNICPSLSFHVFYPPSPQAPVNNPFCGRGRSGGQAGHFLLLLEAEPFGL
ncbi:hypothetical protein BaRGS_00030800 [Batillaria attramentaria]|uniref:Uncharacterized protein n=1 Tax=Batillaria attramentaria TaxID=370345 RepID=A0ABD0JT96_9CAEN